jgi:predicted DCC family thiol-disulfide oxidoreductase YuxK
MRRLVSDLAAYARALTDRCVQGWNRFFFLPADPTPLGLIRILVGFLLAWNLVVIGMDLRAYLGSGGWADPQAVHEVLAERPSWAWSLWLVVPDDLLRPVWFVCLSVTVLFAVGLWSRITAPLAWAIAVSTSRRVPVILFGFDQMITAWALYLAVTGASGQAVSVDHFLARLRSARAALARRRRDGRWPIASGAPAPSITANLALRLIQLHLAFIYGMAGLAKLQGPAWWNGFAVWGVVAAGEFRRFDLTWLASYPLILNLMTHAGVALELAYPVLIWQRTLRPLLITTMVIMHFGIDMTLGLTEFGLAMLAGNLAFCSGPWLRSLVAGRVQPSGKVLYDGACPRCRASMAVLSALDPDHVVEPIDLTAVDVKTVHPSLTPEACMRAMHVVRVDGRVSAGFDAVTTLGWWFPLVWPLAALSVIPGVAPLGRWAYNALAASRPRDMVCTDETCWRHAPPASSARTDVAPAESRRSSP